jgi:hypothetical protein
MIISASLGYDKFRSDAVRLAPVHRLEPSIVAVPRIMMRVGWPALADMPTRRRIWQRQAARRST